MMYLLLIAGFVLLIKGADLFVEASSSIAKTLRVPSIIIGLTIVAFGTSAPELAVSTTASLAGNNEIAVGNVIGSNIFNLLVVLGACGVVSPFAVRLQLADTDTAGRTAGSLYALSTIGSIAGTFLAGFVLIAWMGSTAILFITAMVLAAAAWL